MQSQMGLAIYVDVNDGVVNAYTSSPLAALGPREARRWVTVRKPGGMFDMK